MVDPGTMVSVVELSTFVLKLGYRVHLEFFGNERSVDKLEQFNGRLQTLHEFLQEIEKETKVTGSHLIEPFKGTATLQTTLEDSKKFLNKFEKALSERNTVQRLKFVAGEAGSELENLHKRIDRHYDELHHWSQREISKTLRVLRDFMSLPAGLSDRTQGTLFLNSSPDLLPRNGPSGDIANQSHEDLLSTSPRAPEQHEPLRPSSMQSSTDLPQHGVPCIRDSIRDSWPSVTLAGQTCPAGAILVRDPFRSEPINVSDTTGAIYPVSVNSITDEITTTTSTQALRSLAPSAIIPIPSSPNFSEGGCVIITLGKYMWSFHPASAAIHEASSSRTVEWANQTTKITHYIPASITKIPHTKPNDKKCQISFLPASMKHVFQVTENGICREMREAPRYQFSHKPDREAFQRRFRGRQYLEMVQALVVRSAGGKHVAKDVHLKVWSRGEQDEEPTFSFAHHGVNEANHQQEYTIRWFKANPEFRDPAKLMLRIYSLETDLDYGKRPHEQKRRSSTFETMLRRPSGSSSKSHSPTMFAGPQILYDAKGIPPPLAIQQLGHLEFEFQSTRLRDNFINVCYEAHHGSRSSRGTTPILDGLPSPQMTSRSASIRGIHELPAFPEIQELPGSGGFHEMYSPDICHEWPASNMPRYTPTDLFSGVARNESSQSIFELPEETESSSPARGTRTR